MCNTLIIVSWFISKARTVWWSQHSAL